jgi:hypothetical protein
MNDDNAVPLVQDTMTGPLCEEGVRWILEELMDDAFLPRIPGGAQILQVQTGAAILAPE